MFCWMPGRRVYVPLPEILPIATGRLRTKGVRLRVWASGQVGYKLHLAAIRHFIRDGRLVFFGQ